MFQQQMRDAEELLRDYQRNEGSAGAEVPLSHWQQRRQAEHEQWRQQAPLLFCASLQQQAGPADTSQCSFCGSNDVTVR
jgi:hypothetical protein